MRQLGEEVVLEARRFRSALSAPRVSWAQSPAIYHSSSRPLTTTCRARMLVCRCNTLAGRRRHGAATCSSVSGAPQDGSGGDTGPGGAGDTRGIDSGSGGRNRALRDEEHDDQGRAKRQCVEQRHFRVKAGCEVRKRFLKGLRCALRRLENDATTGSICRCRKSYRMTDPCMGSAETWRWQSGA